jgi:hypothetical protein
VFPKMALCANVVDYVAVLREANAGVAYGTW